MFSLTANSYCIFQSLRKKREVKSRLALTGHSQSGRASLAKDVIAMANSGGGTIVFGVAEPRPGEFVPRGLSTAVLDSLETSRLNRAINDYVDPPVSITARRVQEGDQVFVLLTVPAAKGSLVLVKKQNDEAGLYPGRIYARSMAAETAEVKSSSELRELLEQLERRSRCPFPPLHRLSACLPTYFHTQSMRAAFSPKT